MMLACSRASLQRSWWVALLCSALSGACGGPSSLPGPADEGAQAPPVTPSPSDGSINPNRGVIQQQQTNNAATIATSTASDGTVAVDCASLSTATLLKDVKSDSELRALCYCYINAGPSSELSCDANTLYYDQAFPIEDCAAELDLELASDCKATVGDLLACGVSEQEQATVVCSGVETDACRKVTACLGSCKEEK